MTEPAAAPAAPPGGLPRRWTYAVLLLALLFVLMPFLFWRATWFGRPLADADITRDLADREHPRRTQHALSQIADRLGSPHPGVRTSARTWYPQVAALAASGTDEIRITAAWVMGLDNQVPEFRETLRRLLGDPHPMVRRNAALSLVRFGDASGLAEIRAMLAASTVRAPREGTLDRRLQPGDAINPGTLLGRIHAGEAAVEVRSPVPGTLEHWLADEGATLSADDPLATIAPSSEIVWEALRALVLVGTAEDLPAVERYARGVPGMPEILRRQAEATARAIRSRSPG